MTSWHTHNRMPSRAPRPSPRSTDEPLPLPRRFGRYLLFDRIGRGGMADIYLALEETGLGASRRLVVKQILPHLSENEHFSQLLIDEAKLVAGLRHASIAQVTDLGREDRRLYIAMEYVEGFDLNQLLRAVSKRRIPLPVPFNFLIVREVLLALDFAHRATGTKGETLGIVHRDVSPSNVLISFEGEVKLCDFGIAKAARAGIGSGAGEGAAATEGSQTRARVIGKAAYMSPEQARGDDEVDARSDIFGVGILLWELCAGRRLYRGTEEEMLEQARKATIPPLPKRGLPNHAALSTLLARALAPDVGGRYQSAQAMIRALDRYTNEAKLMATPLKLRDFLNEHFEEETIAERRAREVAAQGLLAGDHGPPKERALLEKEAPPEEPKESRRAKKKSRPGGDDEPTGRIRTRKRSNPSKRPSRSRASASTPGRKHGSAPSPKKASGAMGKATVVIAIVAAIVALSAVLAYFMS